MPVLYDALRFLSRISCCIERKATMDGAQIEQPRGRFALTGGRIILPQCIATDKAVIVEGAKIVAIAERDAVGRNMETFAVDGRYITPGLIDIHIHGAFGNTFNQPTPQAFAAITEATATRGLTLLLATIATAPIPDLVQCLAFSRQWMRASHTGSLVLGVHLEGPYFSHAQKGAQDPAHLRTPDDSTAHALLEFHDIMRMM